MYTVSYLHSIQFHRHFRASVCEPSILSAGSVHPRGGLGEGSCYYSEYKPSAVTAWQGAEDSAQLKERKPFFVEYLLLVKQCAKTLYARTVLFEFYNPHVSLFSFLLSIKLR